MTESTLSAPAIPFQHSYTTLPDRLWVPVDPTPVSAPRLLVLNETLAHELGIATQLGSPLAPAMLAGNVLPPGAKPIALAYAGHQFAHFVPQLGDGRAILLGELRDVAGQRRDVQLKGAGPTPFSRGGDGRAAIGPVLREFLVSEAMHALGVPTTRSLAAVTTGEAVWREVPLPGAVLARVAASHLRVGTFQFAAARNDMESLRALTSYALTRHYPDLADSARPALALLRAVGERQAALVASWMHVGFIHGVMNTDNSSISGETLDYGPCAFLDEYDPGKVFSSIDRRGRYAFANQAVIAHWNLARLAECLLPLIDSDDDIALDMAHEAISEFPLRFRQRWLDGMRAKLGLSSSEEGDEALANDLLTAMQAAGADYTVVFRSLSALAGDTGASGNRGADLPSSADFDAWLARWRERCARDPLASAGREAQMRATNPAVIPRNHLVEQALASAAEGDLAPFHALLAAVRRPFDDDAATRPYMQPPQPDQRVTRTFCGT
jgi:uncharacterized protein YdiU (UPF0061 family)